MLDHLAEIMEELRPQLDPELTEVGLEVLASQVYLQRQAALRVREEGLMVLDGRGNPVPHPAIAIERDLRKEILGWLEKYRREPGVRVPD